MSEDILDQLEDFYEIHEGGEANVVGGRIEKRRKLFLIDNYSNHSSITFISSL